MGTIMDWDKINTLKMKTDILAGLQENKYLLELREYIVKFKKEGGGQSDAQRILEEVRGTLESDSPEDDLMLELLDFVVGSCRKELRIWE